jgi:hypothetical protein
MSQFFRTGLKQISEVRVTDAGFQCEKVDPKFELFEQGFFNHVHTCLSMLHCEVFSYHFKSIYYKHHHFVTNENNYLTLNDWA